MNLVDSSGWLEYFTDGENAEYFAPPIEDIEDLMVSTINVYEVYKKVISEKGEDAAIEAAAMMQQGRVIDITVSLSMQAAKFSYIFKIPMADSIIYVTAREYNAFLWTLDSDFKELSGVTILKRKKVKNI